MTGYRKKIYNFGKFSRDLVDLVKNMGEITQAYRGRHIDWAFAEKIMLATTSVNDCRYCHFAHTNLAERAGAGSAELSALWNHEWTKSIKDEEVPALLFAVHYAETNRNPAPAEVQKIVDYYGPEKAKDIQLLTQFIYFMNLSGNTYDAFLNRLKGNPAADSNPVFETFFCLLAAPATVPIQIAAGRGGLRSLEG